SVDPSSGALTEVPGSPSAGGFGPVAFNPAGDRLAADANDGMGVAVYAVDASSGALSQVGGSPFAIDGTNAWPPPYLGFSPDGSFLAVAENVGKLAVFSTASDPPTASINGPADGQTWGL